MRTHCFLDIYFLIYHAINLGDADKFIRQRVCSRYGWHVFWVLDGNLSSSIQLCHSCTPEIPQGTRQYCNPEPTIMDANRPQHGVLCTCVYLCVDYMELYMGGPGFFYPYPYYLAYLGTPRTCSCRAKFSRILFWNVLEYCLPYFKSAKYLLRNFRTQLKHRLGEILQ